MENIAESNVMIAPKKRGMRTQTRQLLTIAAGTVAGFLIATVLHFVWEWSGGLLPAALFGAVNESVWEHVKILAWAYLMWGVAEYFILKPELRQYIAAKTIGVLSVMVLTVCFFYIYSGILGSTVTWVDISSAALWLLCGEIIGVRVINSPARVGEYGVIFAALLAVLIVALLCFTASPPHIGLFRDPITGLYGLEMRP